MFISPIQNISFKATNKICCKNKKNGKMESIFLSQKNGNHEYVASHYTFMFRPDLFALDYDNHPKKEKFKPRVHSIISAFPGDEKVNIYNFACSDGSEPYSLAVSIINEIGLDAAQRFFPIQASDISPQIISQAKSSMRVPFNELSRLNSYIDTPEKYFSYRFDIDPKEKSECRISPKKILDKAVRFSIQDGISGISQINTKNNVILFRNVWKYLKKEQIFDLCKSIQNLPLNSIFVIGSYDIHQDADSDKLLAPYVLSRLGFDECDGYDKNCLMYKKRKDVKLTDEQIRKIVEYVAPKENE